LNVFGQAISLNSIDPNYSERSIMLRAAHRLLMALALVVPLSAAAQTDPHAADRKLLLALVADAEAALNAGDIERFVSHFDEAATVTWLNAEVTQGRDGIRTYYRKMVGDAPGAILTKYLTFPKVSTGARFYTDDIATAYGTTADEFHPKTRHVFKFDSRWTATLLKRDNRWLITTLHLSTNVFTNELTAEYESLIAKTGWMAGGAGLIAGLAIGWFAWRRRRT
jgi:uncharacterized protein (TIGR02246 family)